MGGLEQGGDAAEEVTSEPKDEIGCQGLRQEQGLRRATQSTEHQGSRRPLCHPSVSPAQAHSGGQRLSVPGAGSGAGHPQPHLGRRRQGGCLSPTRPLRPHSVPGPRGPPLCREGGRSGFLWGGGWASAPPAARAGPCPQPPPQAPSTCSSPAGDSGLGAAARSPLRPQRTGPWQVSGP